MTDVFLQLISDDAFKAFLGTFGLAVLLVLYFTFYRDPKRERDWQVKNNKLLNDLQTKYDQLMKDYVSINNKLVSNLQTKYDQLMENYNSISQILNDLQTHADQLWESQCEEIRKQNRELRNAITDLNNSYSMLENDLRPHTRVISKEQASALANLGLDRDLYKLSYYMREKILGKKDADISTFVRDSILSTNQLWNMFVSPFPKHKNISELYDIYSMNGRPIEIELERIMNNNKLKDDERITQIWKLLLSSTVEMKIHFDGALKKLKTGDEIKQYTHKPSSSIKQTKDTIKPVNSSPPELESKIT